MIATNTVKYGLIAAFIGIFITICTYLAGPSALAGSIWSGLIFLAIYVVSNLIIYIAMALKIRKDEGGLITFKKLFLSLTVILVMASVIGGLFAYILYGVIDPGFMEQAKEMALSNLYAAEDNMPAAQFENAVKRTEEGFNNSLGKTLMQMLTGIIGWSIFNAILALIVKKKEHVA